MLARPVVRIFSAALAVSLPLAAQSSASVDDAAVEFLRQEGLERSQVMDHLSWICDVFGGRLTGSPNIRRAQDWALGRLEEMGLDEVRQDEWGPFGRSWRLVDFAMKVEGENPWPVLAWPKAWSPSLSGEVTADVIDADALSADELRKIDLSDKIVLTESARPIAEWFVGTGHRFTDSELLAMADGRSVPARETGQPGSADFRTGFAKRQAMMALFQENRPLLMLDRSYKGDSGTLFVTGAAAFPGSDGGRVRAQQKGADVVPQATPAVEHYNRIVRLLQKGLPVRMSVRLQVEMGDDEVMERNLLAEIPGASASVGDEIVMLGAHFDSWQSAGGTTDNGCGSAVMIEAMRLLRRMVEETGRRPQRTIRLALWSGEEQGLLGSRAYVAEHVAERGEPPVPLALHDKISCYLNLDNGTGRVRGVYCEGNEAVAPIFRAWFRPCHDVGATTINLGNTGGTDHLAFDAVGVPGFQFIQDPISYSTRTHHSNMDHVDHAVPEDLMQAATVIASCAWHAANRAEMLPRKGR